MGAVLGLGQPFSGPLKRQVVGYRDREHTPSKQLGQAGEPCTVRHDLDSHRADAARNFDAILESARTLFHEQGPDVMLADVAKRAGVGIATLYRHFPTKEDLVEVDTLCQHGEHLARRHSTSLAARCWRAPGRQVTRTR
jgi:tetracycline repressor-like protein